MRKEYPDESKWHTWYAWRWIWVGHTRVKKELVWRRRRHFNADPDSEYWDYALYDSDTPPPD